MNISEQWLREWVSPSLTTEALVHQITMAGLEVDSVSPVAGAFSGVVVAEIISAQQHPDADKEQAETRHCRAQRSASGFSAGKIQ